MSYSYVLTTNMQFLSTWRLQGRLHFAEPTLGACKIHVKLVRVVFDALNCHCCSRFCGKSGPLVSLLVPISTPRVQSKVEGKKQKKS